MVVIRGEAITAGSTCSFSAATGRMPPMICESRMVQIKVRHTTSATEAAMRSNTSSFTKLHTASVLTAYIPMLTDAGGNAGSQSTSTVIRGMAVGDIQPHDLPRILWRESRVALLCGGTLAVCNFVKLLVFDRIAASVALMVCLNLLNDFRMNFQVDNSSV